jgi:hypothetical protein
LPGVRIFGTSYVIPARPGGSTRRRGREFTDHSSICDWFLHLT